MGEHQVPSHGEQRHPVDRISDLGHVVYTPEGFHHFLTTPLPAPGGRSPLQAIEQGDADRVFAALAADYEGLGT